jgi:uncharacterized membrane protein
MHFALKTVKSVLFLEQSLIEKVTHLFVQQWILIIAVFLYIVYFTLASFLRHDNFLTGKFDLGNMVQTVWNTSQGRFFQFTDPSGIESSSRLINHADFILILLAPLYIIFPTPKLLLLLQSLVLGLGAVFVYLLAREVIKDMTLSTVFALSYLLNPSVERSNLFDFHPVTFATTFLLGAFYFIKIQRYGWFLVFAFFSGLTKENVWLAVSVMGLYVMFNELHTAKAKIKNRKDMIKELLTGKGTITGFVVFVVALSCFIFLIWYAMPHARAGKQHFALEYFSEFGQNPSDIISNIFLSPAKVVSTVLLPDRLDYLLQLFLPLGFLPSLAPLILLIALPDFLINLLSNNENLHQIYFQYTSTLSPFLFIASIYGVRTLRVKMTKFPSIVFSIYILSCALIGASLFGPLPFSASKDVGMFVEDRPNRKAIEEYLQSLPENLSIAASNQLGAHIAERERLSAIPVGIEEANMVIFLLSDGTVYPSQKAHQMLSKSLLDDPNYTLVKRIDDFLVFRNNLRDDSSIAR